MTEWIVDYGSDLAGRKKDRMITRIAYLTVFCPEGGKLPGVFEILLFGLRWLSDSLGMSETETVIVHGFPNLVHVPLLNSMKERVDELELRGAVGF